MTTISKVLIGGFLALLIYEEERKQREKSFKKTLRQLKEESVI